MALLTKVKGSHRSRAALTLERADIICVRGANWLARSIIKAEYGKNPPGDAVSHCGICVGHDEYDEPEIVEALTSVEQHPLCVTVAGCQAAWALRCDGLSDAQRAMMAGIARGFVGRRYGYLDLLLQGADALSGTRWFTDHLAWWLSFFPICSYVAGEPYNKALGANFWGVADRSLRPSDIMAYADTHTATKPFSWSKVQIAG